MGKDKQKNLSEQAVLATNRKAFHDYDILEKYEAGIVLTGSEVKSIKSGQISLSEGYAKSQNNEIFLYNINVMPYEKAHDATHFEPKRIRRLLLHKKQIIKISGSLALKGYTLIPLRCYIKNGRIKIELALGKGKHLYDKREALRRKTADLEAKRAIMRRR